MQNINTLTDIINFAAIWIDISVNLLSTFWANAPNWIKIFSIFLPIILFWISTQKREALMEIGDETTIVNAPYIRKAGHRSTVVGATDLFGNSIYTQPMAIGHGAKAGYGSIAIGANAGAGIQPNHSLDSTTPTE
jgi:hypothetical protein